ncbi:glycosyl hydrolase family 62-domain-containing protein [Ephemerocybe angulata]|uniref:Alpha-L-arabinofuranosidase n=1 Tax=Ephemerocybe angulata TaxID=980116 RepID=A0A8H6LUQ5_9AGAR|nr:glycosyl hydrolase family 62-domain-containing protein [Tulosesus angulatus]
MKLNPALLYSVFPVILTAFALPSEAGSKATVDGAIAGATRLPSSFRWNSSGVLIARKNDGRGVNGIKDPSVVFYNGRWHVFATTAVNGWSMVHLSFTDWNQAGNATFNYLDQSGIGTGYRAAPQVFYFEPQKLWYLVYQNNNAAYSTNPDINNPKGWTAPKTFYTRRPTIIDQNIGSGYWVDMWAICDASNCHLFSSDDNGHLYRSQTSLANFPNGFGEPVIAMRDTKERLFEASNLLLVEAIGTDGRRYFRSWTAAAIAGPWTALADTESNPFARANNVAFPNGQWTKDISHGEMLRSGYDQTLTISSCNIRYLYQGLSPTATGDYGNLPYRLALLTQTNSPC